jgi:hypothetical protein
MVGLGTRSAIERAEIGNSRPKAVRASALPDRRLRTSLARSRLGAVRPGARAMPGDRAEHQIDNTLSSARGRLCQLAVKGRQRLAASLQTHLAQHHPVLQGRLGHDRAEPVTLLNELQRQERERACSASSNHGLHAGGRADAARRHSAC